MFCIMKAVTVFVEHRFCRTDQGVWGAIGGSKIWQRYLDVFDAVNVVARVRQDTSHPAGWERADGDRVTFLDIPYYIGPWQYLRKVSSVTAAVSKALELPNAVMLRVPSQLAAIAYPILVGSNRPYGIEVIADPNDVFRGGSRLRLSWMFRLKFVSQLKKQCKNAVVVSYVTEKVLQAAYPASPSAFVTHYSSVDLSNSLYAPRPRRFPVMPEMPTIFTAGSLESFVKGIDVLMNAAATCRRSGVDLRVLIAGEGRSRHLMEAGLGMLPREYIRFLGQLTRAEVLAQMEQADLFVLPSRSEGLPAAIIEAMAKGLPCISTHVGGIPELLPPDDLVPPGNGPALAGKILEVLRNPSRMESMSARNLAKAYEYHENNLSSRRLECYTTLRKKTQEAWVRGTIRRSSGGS
jgi:glycosyltransferase involved in cell wall biosynthesis